MATVAEVLTRGTWTILVVVRSGHSPAVEHMRSLAESERRKVVAFLERTAQRGPLAYPQERNRKLAEHIFELKPTSQVRLPYFFDGPKRMVITHGFTKKKGRTPPEEIERAQRLRAEYLMEAR